MTRCLTAGVLALALVVPPAAVATHAEGASGGRDFAVAGGGNEFALGALGEARFALGATSEPLGTRPAGYVTSAGDPDGAGPLEPFTAQGPVTCLRVEGNRATIKWRIARATGSAAPFEGGGVQSFLEDNGRPRGGTPPDRAVIDPPQPAAAFAVGADLCDDPNTRAAAYETLDRGNITVHDAAGR